MFSQKFQMNAFIVITAITYILYMVSLLGLSKTNTAPYVTSIHSYIQIYVSLFLMYRFNPFRNKKEFSELDKQIAFTAGTFLLMSGTIGVIIKKYLNIKD
jgi:hypothetical protein